VYNLGGAIPGATADVHIEFFRDSTQNKFEAAEVKFYGVMSPESGAGGDFNDGD